MIGAFLGLPVILLLTTTRFIRWRRRSARSAGPVALVAGNLLVLLTLLSVLLLGAETWFRFFRDTTDSFGNTRACERWYERHFRLNGSGFRDDVEYAARIRKGRRRITILGDSFAAGHGIRDVADRFPNRIRRESRDLEVHTMAIPGTETGAHVRILDSALRSGYELDTVVLAYCLNDISDLIPGLGEEYLEAVRGMAGKNAFVRHSYFLDFLDSRLRIRRFPILRDYFGYVRDAYQGPTWARQRGRLSQLMRRVERGGGRFALVVFPFFDRLEGDSMSGARRALEAWAEEERVPFLDLLPVYRQHADEDLVVNAFDAHPNERAHAIAATEILAFLRGRGLTD